MAVFRLYICVFGLKKGIIGNHRFPQFQSLGQGPFSPTQSTEGQLLLNSLNDGFTADGDALCPVSLMAAAGSFDFCFHPSPVSIPK